MIAAAYWADLVIIGGTAMQKRKACVALLTLSLLGQVHAATNIFVTGFGGGGSLTFRRHLFATNFWVEWAPTVNGPWSSSWDGFADLHPISNSLSLKLPLFYRITSSVSNDPSLLLYYPLDDDSGLTVRDHAGAHHATVYGATLVPDGKVGGAMRFDGTNDYLDVPHAAELEFGSAFTLSMWFKRTRTSNEVLYVKQRSPLVTGGGSCCLFSQKAVFDVHNRTSVLSATSATDTNNWHHLVITEQSGGTSNLKVYLDGGLDASVTVTSVTATGGNIKIGIDYDGVNYPFKGLLDEIMFFNRTLSADEVKRLYDSQK